MVRPFGNGTSTGCGSFTFKISLLTGALLSRCTLEGSCLVSAPGPCGCCADKPAVSTKSAKFSDNIFFSMVFSLPHSGSADGGAGRAGLGDHNRASRGHKIFLG